MPEIPKLSLYRQQLLPSPTSCSRARMPCLQHYRTCIIQQVPGTGYLVILSLAPACYPAQAQLMDLTRSLEAREADLKAALAQGRQLANERDGLERVAAKVGGPHYSVPAYTTGRVHC